MFSEKISPPLAGIVLASDQPNALEWPAALLPLPNDHTLLEKQVELLTSASCQPVIVVTGAHGTAIRDRHQTLSVMWGHNVTWQGENFASLQVGLALALSAPVTGALILPVDAAAVSSSILRTIFRALRANPSARAIIPQWNEQAGYPIYFSRALIEELVHKDPAQAPRELRDILGHIENSLRLPIEDSHITVSIRAQSDWRSYLDSIDRKQ